MMPMPTRTCRALHGWRRCGKRSPAPRATPQSTISSENRWFSRCSGCLRKRRGDRSVSGAIPSIPVELLLGIRGGQEKTFEEEKDQEGIATRRQNGCEKRARQENRGCGQEGEEEDSGQESETCGQEAGCKKGRQEIGQEVREGEDASFGAEAKYRRREDRRKTESPH